MSTDGASAPGMTPPGQTPAEQDATNIDYQQLFQDVKEKPCQVSYIDKLYETGHEDVERRPLRTKAHIIERELQRVYDAKTLDEIHGALVQAAAALEELDTFKRIDIVVTEQPEKDREACTVLLDLEEKNWYRVNVATYVQGAENTVEAGFGLHNALGNAEHLTASGEFGSEKSKQLALSYVQPRPAGLPVVLSVRAHQSHMNHEKHSSYTEQLRGLVLAVKSGQHSFQYDGGWRNVADPSHHASPSVVQQLGDDLKSCLRYTYTVVRKDPVDLTRPGWAVKATSEVGGLAPQTPGSPIAARFAKQHLDFHAALPVVPGVALCLSLAAGAMLPLEKDGLARPTSITERFHLGGSSSLRGFRFKGVGPSDERRKPTAIGTNSGSGGSDTGAGTSGSSGEARTVDALGGDLYTSVMAALTFQIPTPVSQALKLHAHMFVNGGNNVQLAGTGRSLKDSWQRFSQSLRWSAGAGFVLPMWFGRFEANYVVLLSHQQQDRIRPGLQLGFASSPFV